MFPLDRTLRKLKIESPSCPICNRTVSLETCKIDEDGQAMHEQCYVDKICSRQATVLQTTKKTA